MSLTLKEVIKHPYDVDMVDAYLQLIAEANRSAFIRADISKGDYIDLMWENFRLSCWNRGLSQEDFDHIIRSGHPVLVSSSEPSYEFYLCLALITFDIHRIDSFLDYQNVGYLGPGYFPVRLENIVYDLVRKNSPFKNDIRLKAIMKWVRANRKFDLLFPSDVKAKNGTHEKFIWKSSIEELRKYVASILATRQGETKPLIVDHYNRSVDDLIFTLFQIQGSPDSGITNSRPLQVLQNEYDIVVEFYNLNQKGLVEFNCKDSAHIARICHFFINRRGQKYKVRQLQTLISKFPTVFK